MRGSLVGGVLLEVLEAARWPHPERTEISRMLEVTITRMPDCTPVDVASVTSTNRFAAVLQHKQGWAPETRHPPRRSM
jgi:hypothetical protein